FSALCMTTGLSRGGDRLDPLTYCVGSGLSWKPSAAAFRFSAFNILAFTLASYSLSLSKWANQDESHSDGRELLQRLQHIGLHLGLVLFHRLRDILLAVLEHPVDQTRQLVRGRLDCSASADPTADAAVEQAQRRHGPAQRLRTHPQREGHSVGALAMAAAFFVWLLSSCGGHSRSQLAKCFSVGKRLTSTPISPRITRAVATSIPSIKVR